MSIEAQTWARAQTTGNAARKSVLMCLAEEADAAGVISRIYVMDIAEWTELSRASTFARLKELEAGGALRREHHKSALGALIVSVQLNLACGYRPPGRAS